MGSADRYFSQIKAQKFTYLKIVIFIDHSHPVGVYMRGGACVLTYFLEQCPLDTLLQRMPVRHSS
jgi:hypothetical protein